MGYEVRPDGVIIAATLDEAIALSKRLRESADPAEPSPARQRQAQRSGATGTSPEQQAAKAKALLAALDAAGKAGIRSVALAEKVGAHPKGLSSYVQAARQAIKEKGGRAEKILWRERTAKEGATWYVNSEKIREIGLV